VGEINKPRHYSGQPKHRLVLIISSLVYYPKNRVLGLESPSLVVLTYHHGGAELATSGKFFHGFGALWEGGIRVPMILRWPAGVYKGIVSSESKILLDVAPTVLSAASIQPDQPMDRLNLLNDINVLSQPRALFWRIVVVK